MFEAIEDTNTMEAVEVAQHVQAIFSKAKTLNETMDDLTEQEKKRRAGTPLEHQKITHAIQVQGLPAVKQSYSDNMAELETDGVSISELYLHTIQEQTAEVESRLEGIHQHQASLRTKLDELVTLESFLNNQSGEYSRLMAQGDIAAADALEAERLKQLQATSSERQHTEHKLAAVDKAESILKKDVGIYREMFIKAHRNLLMQKYNKALLPAFRQQFEALAETFTEMNRIMGKINTGKYAEWEHWATVHELLEKKGHNFIDSERLKEQQYYQSLK